MKPLFLLAVAALSLCTQFVRAEEVVEQPAWKAILEEHQVTGTILIYNLKDDRYHVFDAERARRPYPPLSTFKVPNSLIALETGVVRDENELFSWDGTRRSIDAWNRDHTLRTGIKASAVPVYQEIARRIGWERMQQYLDKFDYGNRDISGGIDRFWLGSSLQTSAFDQIKFLRRLHLMQLPVSERAVRIVKDIMITEATGEYIMRGKTGFQPGLGWWVGWVEKDDNTWFFASNLDVADPSPVRKLVVQRALSSLGVLPVVQ